MSDSSVGPDSAGGLVFVDGRDALATVIIRPTDDGVTVDAQANGISKAQGAAILRHVADQWDPDHEAAAIEDWQDG